MKFKGKDLNVFNEQVGRQVFFSVSRLIGCGPSLQYNAIFQLE